MQSPSVAVQGQLRTPPACLVCVLSHTITVGHPVLRASCAGSLGERFTQRIHGPVFSSLSFSSPPELPWLMFSWCPYSVVHLVAIS
uniref:Secreted protein n=1 Tax=Knipowitschia caucasica TaxID=637954 RepID=A0AAV2JL01_KNICA